MRLSDHAIIITACIFLCAYLTKRYYTPINALRQQQHQQAITTFRNHMTEICRGIEHIRAFSWQNRTRCIGLSVFDNLQTNFYEELDTQRWLGLASDCSFSVMSILLSAIGIFKETSNATHIGICLLMLNSLKENATFVATGWVVIESCWGRLVHIINTLQKMPQESLGLVTANGPLELGKSEVVLQNVVARFE